MRWQFVVILKIKYYINLVIAIRNITRTKAKQNTKNEEYSAILGKKKTKNVSFLNKMF